MACGAICPGHSRGAIGGGTGSRPAAKRTPRRRMPGHARAVAQTRHPPRSTAQVCNPPRVLATGRAAGRKGAGTLRGRLAERDALAHAMCREGSLAFPLAALSRSALVCLRGEQLFGARKRCEHPVERTHEQSAKAARCKSPLPPSIAVRARMRSTQPRLRARAETVGEAHTASLRARDSTKYDVLLPLNPLLSHVIQQPWSSGRILACHAGDPSSILGGCKSNSSLLSPFFALKRVDCEASTSVQNSRLLSFRTVFVRAPESCFSSAPKKQKQLSEAGVNGRAT